MKSSEEINEEDSKFWDKMDRADIGNKIDDKGFVTEKFVSWNRPFQKIMEILQLIFAGNLISCGFLGSWLQSFISATPNSWVTHLIVSAVAIIVINLIRRIVAVLQGKTKKNSTSKYV